MRVEPEEVATDLYRIELPLPLADLPTVNVFACVAREGVLLIDCGMWSDESWDTLVEGLAAIGVTAAGVRQVLLTHGHADHVGLAHRLQRESGCSVRIHHADRSLVLMKEATSLLVDWLLRQGASVAEAEEMAERRRRLTVRSADVPDLDHELVDGDTIAWGDYSFRALWCPGHSQGSTCIYEERHGILVSGDHVLERITSHIGTPADGDNEQLQNYLCSLRRLHQAADPLVLGGHGLPFRGLPGRIDQLLAHHSARCHDILQCLGDLSPYEVAQRLEWRGSERGWDVLSVHERQLALTETVAHLDLLAAQKLVTRTTRAGRVHYMRN